MKVIWVILAAVIGVLLLLVLFALIMTLMGYFGSKILDWVVRRF